MVGVTWAPPPNGVFAGRPLHDLDVCCRLPLGRGRSTYFGFGGGGGARFRPRLRRPNELFAELAASGLPPRSRDEVSAKMATAGSLRSTIDEYVRPSAAGQAAALTDFAGKPLVVLTAGSGHDAAWTAAQNHLATLSTGSVHRVVAGATHASLID
jgi:hypothetical protein